MWDSSSTAAGCRLIHATHNIVGSTQTHILGMNQKEPEPVFKWKQYFTTAAKKEDGGDREFERNGSWPGNLDSNHKLLKIYLTNQRQQHHCQCRQTGRFVELFCGNCQNKFRTLWSDWTLQWHWLLDGATNRGWKITHFDCPPKNIIDAKHYRLMCRNSPSRRWWSPRKSLFSPTPYKQ